ncbi:glycosyltransferase [Streptococcus sp. zg-86]|uniref:Glycosyltransferase n=1 Tax=Streptococcus zhangguiae TaxID=2664091 RepID=A0A6I4RS35_9STRE|nr:MULTISPECIES: glycosyltransferase family 2 protein [unclassified Streptococcus]MTB64930.1 glycosyltransferase [Streptococcus sp. zg-86]MTB91144.1 glycosyltransferase [Streptococcus sp. zg-36]MWV56985.1 glycosyltransferase [Streptococcus sp. zg-70]QTH47219.1 glycosyltransferase family 2 protein [Streptococcus sp. zg-86]
MARVNPILYMVIPCYNEEQVLPETSGLFLAKLEQLIADKLVSKESRILYVNDGSSDKTWELIEEYAQNPYVVGIAQSRNRGHQSTVLAGMMEAKEAADIVITIDCDGQDDINCMDEMVKAYQNGAEVVYGVRKKRTTDTFFKRATAEGFYNLLEKLGVEVIFNHADYRLMSKRALEALSEFSEVNLFLRGMVPMVGFNYAIVEYDRFERIAGESHYPLSKMIGLAIDGITSLSVKPLRFITGLGVITSIVSFLFILWTIFRHFFGFTVSGWASTVTIIAFIGGIQLISIGIIGEYIGKIYLETKKRPRYIIDKRTDKKR